MESFRWLYLDLNSYFASVEQQNHKELRGKPVVVVPVLTDSTSVIASSTEARKFGIKTGTKVGEAKRLCRDLILRLASHEAYVETHARIAASLEKVLPISSVCSIDEMAFSLMGREREEAHAIAIAKEMKRRIKEEVGETLTCSIGLAPNRYLAKVASDRQKPDGLVTFRKEELPDLLHHLELRDFPGIGPKMEERMIRWGIQTCAQLCSLNEADMVSLWGGVNGQRFYQAIHGEEYEEKQTETQSLSQSNVLSPEFRTNAKAELIAQKLLHKAAARLRKAGLWCAKLSLHISFVDREESFESSMKLIECCDDLTLLQGLKEMWQQVPKWARPIKVGITLSRLVPDEWHTLSLFENSRHRNLSLALDAINQKYGKGSAIFASMKALEGAAPTRIAFTSIPDFDA